jgi:hypothetical protein
VRVKFGVEIPLADFFAAATIRSMSERIEAALVENASAAKIDELLDLVEGLDEYQSDNTLESPMSPTGGLRIREFR